MRMTVKAFLKRASQLKKEAVAKAQAAQAQVPKSDAGTTSEQHSVQFQAAQSEEGARIRSGEAESEHVAPLKASVNHDGAIQNERSTGEMSDVVQQPNEVNLMLSLTHYITNGQCRQWMITRKYLDKAWYKTIHRQAASSKREKAVKTHRLINGRMQL